MKLYTVYFIIKENRTEYLADVVVEAPNAKESCKLCKDWYHKKTGRNAFRPTTSMSEDDRKWYKDHDHLRHFITLVTAN